MEKDSSSTKCKTSVEPNTNNGEVPARKVGRVNYKYLILIVATCIVAMCLILIIGYSRPNDRAKNDCFDNLRTINGALLQYEIDHGSGIFPETIDELVPTYLREIPKEPDGGYYYLDFASRRPRVVCSLGHTY